MTNEENLQQEKSRLSKLMREEMNPFITKIVEGRTTIEMIDEGKKKEIVDKYNGLYKTFETNLLNTAPTYQESRLKDYLAQGITTDVLTVALWEKVVENKPQSADDIQKKRDAIKLKYPKN